MAKNDCENLGRVFLGKKAGVCNKRHFTSEDVSVYRYGFFGISLWGFVTSWYERLTWLRMGSV